MSATKQRRIIFAARHYLVRLGAPPPCRFDVVVVEPTGADTFIACRHHGAEFSVVFRERHDFAPGSHIHLKPDLQRAHVFDADSGRRLMS